MNADTKDATMMGTTFCGLSGWDAKACDGALSLFTGVGVVGEGIGSDVAIPLCLPYIGNEHVVLVKFRHVPLHKAGLPRQDFPAFC